MNRRGFLGALAGAIAGATLDPERALWVPGKRLISIPARNTLLTSEFVALEILRVLQGKLVIANHLNQRLAGQYATVGSNIAVRMPSRFIGVIA